jgi:choline dehydrogenase-like flavoprotein
MSPFVGASARAQAGTTFDAIVVGSGMSGGWAMKELCEAGLRTLVLERGRMVEHGADYVTEHKRPWEMPHRGRIPPDVLARDYPVQRRTYVLDEYTEHFFYKDADVPIVEEEPFTWVQPAIVGGRALLWARQSYRFSEMDLEANAQDGHGVDWPIRYADLAPWYDRVESLIGVSGSMEGLPQLPDGRFQQPMEMNAVEKHAKERIEAAFPGRRVIIGRTATLTEPLGDRAPCHYCGPCQRGCSTGSYYSTQSVALPAARATGNLTLRPHSVVHSVLYDAVRGRASGVRVIDAVSGAEREYFARVVFLCASTMGTARIMLTSTSERFPDGVANSSGMVGRNIIEHHGRVGARGRFEGFTDRYYQGNRPNGIYIPRFRNLDARTRRPDFVRGYGMQGSATRVGWGRGSSMSGFGAGFKERLRTPGEWVMQLQAYGEFLPRPENRCTLDPDVKDRWGIPALRIRVTRGDNEVAMRRDMAATAAEMLEAAGARDVERFDLSEVPPGTANHEMGTARMGRDPRTSVLNGFNQCHDVPNLFVTDGSCMTSSACQNPSLTYLALTARACAYAVEELRRGTL